MSQSFPFSRKSALGYNVEEVEGFLARARKAYEAQPGTNPAGSAEIDSTSIRRVSFGLEKGGYSPEHVDAALERLEDAFVARERARAQREIGEEGWFTRSRERAREIVARLERLDGHKFKRANPLTGGYNRDDVDAFCDRLTAYFRSGAAVTVAEVRGVVFRPRLGGYNEAQVDLVLDAVVDVMLAVR
ncbi:hypothetical protein BH09ACT6_BH09ACT6_10410 [soil metagenome]